MVQVREKLDAGGTALTENLTPYLRELLVVRVGVEPTKHGLWERPSHGVS